MSLRAREKRVLDRIEDRLECNDPQLASLLAIFGRLTSGDEMPVRERIGKRRRRRRSAPDLTDTQSGAGRQRTVRPWVVQLLCFGMCIMLVTAAVVVSHVSGASGDVGRKAPASVSHSGNGGSGVSVPRFPLSG